MLKELKDYLEANHGTVIDFSIDDSDMFGIHFKSLTVNTVVIEKIMDKYNWIEGLAHDYDTNVFFDVESSVANLIAIEIMEDKLFSA